MTTEKPFVIREQHRMNRRYHEDKDPAYILTKAGRMASTLLVLNELYLEKKGELLLSPSLVQALEVLEDLQTKHPVRRQRTRRSARIPA